MTMKNKKHTEETKKIMSEKSKGNKAFLGKKHSEETKLKMSKPRPKRQGIPPWNKGKKGLQANEKNPAWKGGVSMSYKKKNAPRPKPDFCEVCGISEKELGKSLCYDHNHKNGEFRGWICGGCNCALGLVNDNREILLSLVEYLNKNQ